VLTVLALLLVVVPLLAMLVLLLQCAVLVENGHHLFDEIPRKITLPIQRRDDSIKTNQAIKNTMGLARLRQHRQPNN
jgi:hypothetical protein